MDFLLPYWNPLIVHPLEWCLRQLATPLETVMSPGLAGGLAIILFTIVLRVALLPLAMLQIRSQKHQLAIQPELKALQRKFKGDREGMAREQMRLYKERGVNPAAGCLPLVIQLPILFGMYSAMSQLATQGLTLDQVLQSQVQSGQVVYAAQRHDDPLPFNQFVLARMQVVPKAEVTLDVPAEGTAVALHDQPLLSGTSGLKLTPGQAPGNPNPPNTPAGKASVFLRAGTALPDGTYDRSSPVVVGQPITVEIWVDASGTNADSAQATVQYDAAALDVSGITTPEVEDVAFKSRFLWLPSLGQPDVLAHISGFSIPGFLLIIMTISSYVSQRMTTMPTEDPQQQAMMRSMAFMPLMYLFFFLNTPSGLVLYWLISNIFSMFQQYFTVGLGLLAGDLERLTGRDWQPPWAHIPTQMAPAAAVVEGAPTGNGRAARDGGSAADGTTPGSRTRPTQQQQHARSRAGGSKGRKRGKR